VLSGTSTAPTRVSATAAICTTAAGPAEIRQTRVPCDTRLDSEAADRARVVRGVEFSRS